MPDGPNFPGPLAPVATIEENYLVGADETPPETIGNM
jgi:hypothetical protein